MGWRVGKKGSVYKVRKGSGIKSRRKTYRTKTGAKRAARRR